MPIYRLYFMDSTGPWFRALREFEASSDELAAALAEDARGRGPMELWTGNRRVRQWQAVSSEVRLGC